MARDTNSPSPAPSIWSLTIRLLLFGLTLTAMHERLGHVGLLVLPIGPDILMIVTGPFAAPLPREAQGPIPARFVPGCLFHTGMPWILLRPLRAQHSRSGRAPDPSAACGHPVGPLGNLPGGFILGSIGLGRWSAVTSTAVVAVLDVTAKASTA